MSNFPKHQLYGRRQGRPLRKQKQELFNNLLPKIAYAKDKFLFDKPLFLEIGFGGGEHLAFQGQRYPHHHFLGCEPFMNGVADLLEQIWEGEIQNITIHHGDVRFVLEELPNGSLDGAYILDPDPWPKPRHHKRRIVNRDVLNQLTGLLKPGAFLRVASDHSDYVSWMREHLDQTELLERVTEFQTADISRPDDWPKTRYEQKGLAGMISTFFIYRKKTDH